VKSALWGFESTSEKFVWGWKIGVRLQQFVVNSEIEIRLTTNEF